MWSDIEEILALRGDRRADRHVASTGTVR